MQPGQAMCGCPQSDSNRHLADFKSAASANWAMGASQVNHIIYGHGPPAVAYAVAYVAQTAASTVGTNYGNGSDQHIPARAGP